MVMMRKNPHQVDHVESDHVHDDFQNDPVVQQMGDWCGFRKHKETHHSRGKTSWDGAQRRVLAEHPEGVREHKHSALG